MAAIKELLEKFTQPMSNIQADRKVVAAVGTKESLVSSPVPCKVVIITAETDNTGIMVVGGSTVIATLATRKGTPLAAGDSVVLQIDNLDKVFLDTTVNGDGVTYTYLL